MFDKFELVCYPPNVCQYPMEFLNSINLRSMPPHCLQIKKECNNNVAGESRSKKGALLWN